MNNLIYLYIACLFWLVYVARKQVYNLHMMQQNSYRNDRFSAWLQGKLTRDFPKRDLLLLIAAAFCLLGKIKLGFILLLVICAILCLFYRRQKEKKKLVFTPRAKRLYATTLAITVIYGLFVILAINLVPYRPANVLGTVICLWLFLGVVASWALLLLANFLLAPLEKSINSRYLNDAKRIIGEMPRLQTIGITGSFGKTSTKFILSRVLAEKYRVLVTPESYNTPMGITKTIRTMLKPTHQFFVTEMGAKQKGDIAELCELVQPKIGIITAIGEQHLESFGSLENIVKTKFELMEKLPPEGLAVLNFDNEYIREAAKSVKARVVSYGLNFAAADYKAENIAFGPSGMTFDIVAQNGSKASCRSRLLGKHNVSNMLAAAACGAELGMSLAEIANGLAAVEPVPHRLVLQRTAQNVNIIDDAFNSNPVGAQVALEVLAGFAGGKKILITPGMVELGPKQYELNKAFAVSAAAVCDYIILVGKKNTLPLQDGLAQVNFSPDKLYVAGNLADAISHMQHLVQPGDYVLLENDLPDTYNE